MGIGGVRAIDGMTGRQGAAAQPVDSVSRNIQNEISDVQRQKQGLSSKQEMSVGEKAKKKQELQQELGSLNTQLRLRQEEVRKEQQREALSGEVRAVGVDAADAEKGKPDIKDTEKSKTDGEDAKKSGSRDAEKKNINSEGAAREAVSTEIQAAEKEDKNDKDEKLKDIGMPRAEMQTIVEANSAKEQTRRREAVIARMESGIVILKGEIRQDEIRGADVEKKKAELKKQEKKVQNAASGLPTVGGPSKTTDAVARTKAGGAKEKSVIKGNSEAGVIKSSLDGVVIITQK